MYLVTTIATDWTGSVWKCLVMHFPRTKLGDLFVYAPNSISLDDTSVHFDESPDQSWKLKNQAAVFPST